MRFPNLSEVKRIAIDTETRDPNLLTMGPGYIRRDGYVAGISLSVDDTQWYFPIQHALGPEPPLSRDQVIHFLRDLLARTDLETIYHNATYDMGWLSTLGIAVQGRVRDIQLTETLIDEESSVGYSLDALAFKYLGERKDEGLLREAAESFFLKNVKAEMWKLPPEYVGPYAEADARQTYQIDAAQRPVIIEENVSSIHELETALIPCTFGLTMKGVRVDLDKAEILNYEWKELEDRLLKAIGITSTEAWSPPALAALLKRDGITIPKTDKGNDSVTNGFLASISCHSDLAKNIHHYRELNRCRNTFIEENILKNHIKGRIHAQFNQNRREQEGTEKGTRTGRFSSSYPNLQQIPKRSRLLDSSLIRTLYLPEEGQKWAKVDYDSQEPRLQIHYGLMLHLPGAEAAKEAVEGGKKIYRFIQDRMPAIDYDHCKALYLGKTYGQGVKSLARDLGLSRDKTKEIIQEFDTQFGYITALASRTSAIGQNRGYIYTLLGRKRRFNYYQSTKHWDYLRELQETDAPTRRQHLKLLLTPVDDIHLAEARWPEDTLERAYTNKAFNALIQGGAADQAKKAMLDSYRAGKTIQFPVHDEINFSVNNEAEAQECKELLENAIELKIKTLGDLDYGDTWV